MSRLLGIAAVVTLLACVLLLAGFWRPASGEDNADPSSTQVGVKGTTHSVSTRLPLSLAASGEASPTIVPTATGGVGTALMAGNIGWAEPDLGIDYLATRFPRGTLVRLCSLNGCLIRRTNDFGPSAAIDPPRIADLAVLDWEFLTGLPRSRGLAYGTIETVEEIPLPPTDTEPVQ